MSGCYTTKLRFIPKAVFVNDSNEAGSIIKQLPDFATTVVLENVPKSLQAPGVSGGTADTQRLFVVDFSFNKLDVATQTKSPGSWLYYADNYHEGWKAFIDGGGTTIFPANLSFKALWVPEGRHHVILRYFDGLQGMASYIIAVNGVLFVLVMLIKGLSICLKIKNGGGGGIVKNDFAPISTATT